MPSVYFAYGSNLFPEQMKKTCPDANLIGTALLTGYRFGYFRRSKRWHPGGAADIKKDPNGFLWGAIWNMKESDWERMDIATSLYLGSSERVEVSLISNGKTISGETYLTREKHGEICPAKDHWEKVYKGAVEIGLPEEYTNWLYYHYLNTEKYPRASHTQ